MGYAPPISLPRQVHDLQLFETKSRMHKLYRVKRSMAADLI